MKHSSKKETSLCSVCHLANMPSTRGQVRLGPHMRRRAPAAAAARAPAARARAPAARPPPRRPPAPPGPARAPLPAQGPGAAQILNLKPQGLVPGRHRLRLDWPGRSPPGPCDPARAGPRIRAARRCRAPRGAGACRGRLRDGPAAARRAAEAPRKPRCPPTGTRRAPCPDAARRPPARPRPRPARARRPPGSGRSHRHCHGRRGRAHCRAGLLCRAGAGRRPR